MLLVSAIKSGVLRTALGADSFSFLKNRVISCNHRGELGVARPQRYSGREQRVSLNESSERSSSVLSSIAPLSEERISELRGRVKDRLVARSRPRTERVVVVRKVCGHRGC